MGPIGVKAHLAPFLPGHPVIKTGGSRAVPALSAAPWGSASILLISYAYITMLGTEGMTEATRCAILNANYIKSRLQAYFPVLYTRANGRVGCRDRVDRVAGIRNCRRAADQQHCRGGQGRHAKGKQGTDHRHTFRRRAG